MKTINEVTIHDIKVLTQTREEAKEQAKRLMLKGDLNRYFKKLLEITQMQDELRSYNLAA